MAEVSMRINELTVTITNLNNDKRRLEADLANLQAELEEALSAKRAAEDRADRTQMELNRLAEELQQVRHCLQWDVIWPCLVLGRVQQLTGRIGGTIGTA